MDWTPYINAGASALGSSITALAVIAFFGKYLFDNWFKKDYKKWELERERTNKEDFKRFEGKLDALASRDEAKFNYLHPERAKVAVAMLNTCIALAKDLNAFLDLRLSYKEVSEESFTALRPSCNQLTQCGLDLAETVRLQPYLDKKVASHIESIAYSILVIATKAISEEKPEIHRHKVLVAEMLVDLNDALRELLGNEAV